MSSKLMKSLTALAAVGLIAAAPAQAFDESKELICASIQLDECVDGGDCQDVLPEDVNAPTFFRIDLRKKRLFNGSTEGGAKISNMEKLGRKLILQGITPDAGPEDAGTGWTVSLDPATSRFVAAVTTEQAAVVIFGACTQ